MQTPSSTSVLHLYLNENPSAAVEDMSSDAMTAEIVPNPAADKLHLKANHPITGYSVYDQTGKAVLQGQASGVSVLVDIQSLSSGIYFVKAADKTGNASDHKFLR